MYQLIDIALSRAHLGSLITGWAWTVLASAMALILAAPNGALAANIMINNGLAPPNAANVIDYFAEFDDVYVRSVGCPIGWPGVLPDDPCTSPGAPTEVAFVAGGGVNQLRVYDSSVITMTGGGIAGTLQAYGSSSIIMSGGGMGVFLAGYDSSTITMSGGVMGEALRGYGFSTITMTGGETNVGLQAADSSTITWSGGSTGGSLRAFDLSTITVRGSGFRVDGIPVPYGDLTTLTGTLTGTLESGEGIEGSIFHQGGGGFTGTITLAPEPSAALLLAVGLAGLIAARGHS